MKFIEMHMTFISCDVILLEQINVLPSKNQALRKLKSTAVPCII